MEVNSFPRSVIKFHRTQTSKGIRQTFLRTVKNVTRKSKKIQVYLLCVVVLLNRWTVDIGLDSSIVEQLTSDAGVQGLIPDHAIYFHLCFSVYICLNKLPIPSILKHIQLMYMYNDFS